MYTQQTHNLYKTFWFVWIQKDSTSRNIYNTSFKSFLTTLSGKHPSNVSMKCFSYVFRKHFIMTFPKYLRKVVLVCKYLWMFISCKRPRKRKSKMFLKHFLKTFENDVAKCFKIISVNYYLSFRILLGRKHYVKTF